MRSSSYHSYADILYTIPKAAIRRRFEKRIYIPLPDATARSYMLKLHIGDTKNNLNDDDFDRLGEMTDGASGSDVSVLVRDALMEPLRHCQQAKQFIPVDGGKFLAPGEFLRFYA